MLGRCCAFIIGDASGKELSMSSTKWRTALATVAVVVLGVLIAPTPAYADPIENGGVAQIATAPVGGVRYCMIPTSELRACSVAPVSYTFLSRTCWSTALLCYEIRTPQGECLYYDVELNKIGYTTCATSLRFRWRIDEVNTFGTIRIRPASHTSRCNVYDPAGPCA
jgi:hypothetical protein